MNCSRIHFIISIFFSLGLASALVAGCAHDHALLPARAPAQASPFFLDCKTMLTGIDDNFARKLDVGDKLYLKRLLKNVSPTDQTGRQFKGVVIASPSHIDPDYYYHWIRDAGLTMLDIGRLYNDTPDLQTRNKYKTMLADYVEFSRGNQDSTNRSGTGDIIEEHNPEKKKTRPFTYVFKGYGEPKFLVNGSPYDQDWGRPQSDGPAFRAMALVRFADSLLRNQNADDRQYIKTRIYDSKFPTLTKSVLKRDLEYVLHNWGENSFDVWEEVSGQHFFTLIAQRRALIDGAELAEKMNDSGAAAAYLKGASDILDVLGQFWDADAGIIKATRNYAGGIQKGGLDVAVLLGVLYGSNATLTMPVSKKSVPEAFRCADERVLSTVAAIEADNKSRYKVNQPVNGVEPLAPLIGRYPEDTYDGVGRSQGNPWVLSTFAFAEHAYRVADEIQGQGFVEITKYNLNFFKSLLKNANLQAGQMIAGQNPLFAELVSALIVRGDNFLKRIDQFRGPNGELPEEIYRDATEAGPAAHRGAQNLTWNYVAFDRAVMARKKLLSKMGN